jgi:hypothetical protein
MKPVTMLGKLFLLCGLLVSLQGADFSYRLTLAKHDVYVTQAIEAQLLLKSSAALLDHYSDPLQAQGFWIREQNATHIYKKHGYFYKRITFLLFPQQSGKVVFPPQTIHVAIRQAKTNFTVWHRVTSNAAVLKVRSLPQNLQLQGNFAIFSTIETKNVKTDGVVHYTLTVRGSGGIENIAPFTLKIPNAVVYTTASEVQSVYKNGVYGGVFIQKFAIIAQHSFTVPALQLRYFDPRTGEVRILHTESYTVHVNVPWHEPWYLKYIFAVFGVLLGGSFSFIYKKMGKHKADKSQKFRKIRFAKNDRELYALLLCYAHDDYVQTLLQKLEQNIYFGAKNRIDKKYLVHYLAEFS